MEELDLVKRLTAERLSRFPDSPFYNFALREIEKIAGYVDDGGVGKISRTFYESLNIGLMCARELETVDMPYCDAVYAMLERLRLASA